MKIRPLQTHYRLSQ